MVGTASPERLRNGHSGRRSLQCPRKWNCYKKAAYVTIGTDLEGKKDVLDIWLGASESSKYWLSVLNGLRNRGAQDILIASALSKPLTRHSQRQRCSAVSSIRFRSSTRYVFYKDVKQFTSGLKPIYKAATEETALAALDEFEAQWGKKYPLAMKS